MMFFDYTKLQCSENVSRKSCDIKTQLQHHHHQLMHPSLSSQGCMVGGADPGSHNNKATRRVLIATKCQMTSQHDKVSTAAATCVVRHS